MHRKSGESANSKYNELIRKLSSFLFTFHFIKVVAFKTSRQTADGLVDDWVCHVGPWIKENFPLISEINALQGHP